jgi:hypothetical protein
VLLPGAAALARAGAADRAEAARLRAAAIGMALRDLERFRPDVVAVDRREEMQAMPPGFDVLGFYAADPGFQRAWAAYRLVRSIPGWDFYARAPAR